MSLAIPSNSESVLEIERDYESVQAVALAASTKAELDSQVATAKRFPRQLSRFLSEAKSVVALDPEIAAECIYCLPARRRGDAPITGPSVRLAEIAASCWGNLRITGRIVEDGGLYLVAQGVCIDLEKNVGYSVEVRRGIVTKDGRRYGEDLVKTTANAAIAIATRNATFKVIPRTFVNLLEESAREVSRGTVQTLPDRWRKALDWFAAKGVDPRQIYDHLQIGGPADVNLDHLEILQGYRVAVRENSARPEEIFVRAEPAKETPAPSKPAKGTQGLSERLKGQEQPVTPAPATDSGATKPEPSSLLQTEGGNDD